MTTDHIFYDFDYDRWVPEQYWNISFGDALHNLEVAPKLEDAFVVFWKIVDSPNPDQIYGICDSNTKESGSGENYLEELTNWARFRVPQPGIETSQLNQQRAIEAVES